MADGRGPSAASCGCLCRVALCCVVCCGVTPRSSSLSHQPIPPACKSKLGGITEAGVSDLQAAAMTLGFLLLLLLLCCRCRESWERRVTATAGVRNGASTTFQAVHPYVHLSVLIDTLTDSLFVQLRGAEGGPEHLHASTFLCGHCCVSVWSVASSS